MNRVVAVSVGIPRWTNVYGHQIMTSIVREASDQAIFFGPAGPENNATACHTEQVLATSAQHYDYWTAQFGIAREDWDWARWGENLTLAEADENALKVGDILAVGETARFQITSPRIPCSKLAWRLGQTDQVLREMTRTGRIGIYLRVVTPGWVAPGDPVELVERARDSITVGDLSRLLIDNEIADPAPLRRVLAEPALGSQAAGMILNRINVLTDGARTRAGRWQGWRQMVVSYIREEARGIRSFTLRATDGERLAAYRAGQFITVEVPLPSGAVARTWSLSDYQETGTDQYRISVKAASPDGASAWLHGAAKPGMVLNVRPPSGRFVLERGGFYRIVLISAGIGVTPLFAMLKAHAARGSDAPPLVWVHATRSGATHSFRQESDAILGTLAGARRLVLYSQPDPDDRPGLHYDRAGRLTPDLLKDLIEPTHTIQPFGRAIEIPGPESQFYICGPAGFEAMVRDALQSLGVRPGSIRSERFTAARRGGRASNTEEADVVFGKSGETARWSADDDLSLLELAEAAGLTPDFGCRAGNCQSCETTLKQGDVVYDPEPAVRPAPGRVLLCCARPNAPLIELDL